MLSIKFLTFYGLFFGVASYSIGNSVVDDFDAVAGANTTTGAPVSSTTTSGDHANTTTGSPVISTTTSGDHANTTTGAPVISTTTSGDHANTTTGAPVSSTTTSGDHANTTTGSPVSSTTTSGDECEDVNATACQQFIPDCNNAIYKPMLCGFCKKTCHLCPQHGSDPCAPVTSPSTTPAPEVPSSSSSTTTGAPASSTTTSGDECKDANVTVCQQSIFECNNANYKPIMCSLCKKTCHFCPQNGYDPCVGVVTVTLPPVTVTLPPTTPAPGKCFDVDKNCASSAYECANPLYSSLMCKYCRVCTINQQFNTKFVLANVQYV
uniref:ShKT domain-containing protein n=1 Tax=Panagrolaimus sp. JU765 TaxID=591449 RepID=A0AC34RKT0_9BILA